jgi:plasmid stability protein
MLTINLDDNLKIKLQQQAENNGHTLEEEITEIIRHFLTENQEKSLNLADRIKQRFAHLQDVEIPEITRDEMRTPPNF